MLNTLKNSFSNKEEKEISHVFDWKNINSFHKTQLSRNVSLIVLISFLIWQFIGGWILLLVMHPLAGILSPNNPYYYLLSFGIIEVIPLIVATLIFGQHLQSKTKLQSILSPIRRWSKILWTDFKSNKWFIVKSIFAALIVQFITNLAILIIGKIISPNGFSLTSSLNTQTIEEALKVNSLMLIVISVVAPIFEELTFRFLIPDNLEYLINKIGANGQFVRLVCIFVSALLFGSLHETTFNVQLMTGYITSAFYFQWLRHKTGSITSPIFAHAGSNFLVTVIGLLAI